MTHVTGAQRLLYRVYRVCIVCIARRARHTVAPTLGLVSPRHDVSPVASPRVVTGFRNDAGMTTGAFKLFTEVMIRRWLGLTILTAAVAGMAAHYHAKAHEHRDES